MRETNLERVRRGYEAALRGDLDVIRELLDPDVKWHGGDPFAPGVCRNRDQALAFMREARGGGRIGELVDVRANLTTFRNGKVVEMVHYPDPQDALAAAGL
jgi:ketosteroid isomerase-like protein